MTAIRLQFVSLLGSVCVMLHPHPRYRMLSSRPLLLATSLVRTLCLVTSTRLWNPLISIGTVALSRYKPAVGGALLLCDSFPSFDHWSHYSCFKSTLAFLGKSTCTLVSYLPPGHARLKVDRFLGIADLNLRVAALSWQINRFPGFVVVPFRFVPLVAPLTMYSIVPTLAIAKCLKTPILCPKPSGPSSVLPLNVGLYPISESLDFYSIVGSLTYFTLHYSF
jgi:hypothetical protein